MCRFMNMSHEELQPLFGGNTARFLDVLLDESGDVEQPKP